MKKKLRLRNWVLIVFIILSLGGLVYSSYNIITWKMSIDENKNIQKDLSELIKNNQDNYFIDFQTLKTKNSDTVAYLKVNGTNIDYVVVKGEDNSYYLNHNFNKEKSVAGWIFADYHNKFDGSDKNIVIYGHNMKDGIMFETLKDVLTKE